MSNAQSGLPFAFDPGPTEADRVGHLLLALEGCATSRLHALPLAVRCLNGEHPLLVVFVDGGRHWLTAEEARLTARAIADEAEAYSFPAQWSHDLLVAAQRSATHLAHCQIDRQNGLAVGWGERCALRVIDGGLS